ncbi:ABC transporter ATP-binding protein [Treponema phagedenis]|uniref:Lipid A export ATP-binding/permease protein MsbA n=1 Tax=Treponema phagedenis TaxID=162 RepID=A0A0B7GZ23_TREPH|nr:ABC transporter ATP-binding protein [Treponema phagedenis]NVP25096.1 ABC transporter ATP-binding protein [Treponema phagedenis]QEJ95673.1 ABC transporter ATP-binding protein [Treponema phagedenis]QEK01530.1 ABC transporter ATP-binding protein [Treponema phagedenis]QEK02599.1 ABC transporter ATP-binding protein [Treponema phagedenis]QEK06550.1 ABC transporter ATP-binding protein [Treponema phagedenis]
MLTIFKKIWNFSKQEQSNIKFSLFFGFLNAVFNALQFAAIYYMLIKILQNEIAVIDIGIVSAIMLTSAVGKVLTQNKSQLQQTHAGYFMAAHKRISIGEKLKKVPMGFFSDFSLGKITTLATTSLSQIEIWVPLLLVLVLGGILNTVVFVLSLFFLNVTITAAAVVGIIGFFIVTSLMERKSRRNAHHVQEVQTALTKEVLSTVQGMQVIKSYNLDGENNKELDDSFERTHVLLLKLEKLMIPFTVIQRIVIGLTITCMLYLAVTMYISGTLTLAKTIMSMIASFIIFEGLLAAGSSMAVLRIAENAIDSLDYVNTIPDMEEGKDEKEISNSNIEFKNVSFSYDKKKILDDVSCVIKENTMTALVGPSGSGKTTFSQLIARFWDVNAGKITIGGKDIREYTLPNLMSNISYVFQNVYLFNDTIENNIKFGSPDASREEVIAAAKKACCHDFITALPNQYETIVGEGGAALSGGEKQRISIARAMLKNAPIIIFDEATANVDPENEDKLQTAIEALTKNKTVIMIAHRLKTVRNANQIIVLNDGKIEELGTHNQLMQKEGTYKKFIEARQSASSWKI